MSQPADKLGAMVALAHSSPLTYDDLKGMPDDGRRHELLDGVLLVTPAPSFRHQVAAGAIYRMLHAHRRPGQVVLTAPFDYVMNQFTALEPDVLVARRADFAEANLPATPVLVVEVLSPSTRRIDITAKKQAYLEAGVPAYWLVDPDEPSVTILELHTGRYELVATVAGEDTCVAQIPFPLEITPARLLDDLAV